MTSRYVVVLTVTVLVSALYMLGLTRWHEIQVANLKLEEVCLQNRIDDFHARLPGFPCGRNLEHVSRALRDLESENARLRAEVARRFGRQGLQLVLLQVDDDVRRNQHARRPWSWRNLVYPATPRSSLTAVSSCP